MLSTQAAAVCAIQRPGARWLFCIGYAGRANGLVLSAAFASGRYRRPVAFSMASDLFFEEEDALQVC